MKKKSFSFGEKRIFKKAIAISESHLAMIDRIRGRKSKAGKLAEMIEFYKSSKGIN